MMYGKCGGRGHRSNARRRPQGPEKESGLNFFMGFATIYGLGFLVYFGYKFNWSSPLILFGISLLIKGAMVVVESILFSRVPFIIQIIGT